MSGKRRLQKILVCSIMVLGSITLGSITSGSRAASLWMSEADLEATFAGKTIAGLYPNGRGFVETYHLGGRVLYRDDLRRVFGRWHVASGTFCTIYDGDNTGGCYSVRRMGKNCFEFYFMSRKDGGARQRPEQPTWTAQAWLSDTPSTCVAGAEV